MSYTPNTDYILTAGYTPTTDFIYTYTAVGVGGITLEGTSETHLQYEQQGVGGFIFAGVSATEYVPGHYMSGGFTLEGISAMEYQPVHPGVGGFNFEGLSQVIPPTQAWGIGGFTFAGQSPREYIPYLFNPGLDPFYSQVEVYAGCGHFEDPVDVRDRSRNGHDMIVSGDVAVIEEEPSYNGGVIECYGNTFVVSTPANAGVSPGNLDFTMEARIKPNGLTLDGGIGFIGTYGAGVPCIAFFLRKEYGLTAMVSNETDPNLTIYTADASVSDGVWSHVALVRDSDTLNLFINGVRLTSSLIGSGAFAPADQLFIGYSYYSGQDLFFKGQLEDFIFARGAKYSSDFTPRERSYRYELPIGTREFEERKQKRPAKPRALNQNYFVQRIGI